MSMSRQVPIRNRLGEGMFHAKWRGRDHMEEVICAESGWLTVTMTVILTFGVLVNSRGRERVMPVHDVVRSLLHKVAFDSHFGCRQFFGSGVRCQDKGKSYGYQYLYCCTVLVWRVCVMVNGSQQADGLTKRPA